MSVIGQAIAEVMSFSALFSMFAGTLVGIIAGAIPGFTILMAIILTLPFTFGMDPVVGIATMIGVYVGGFSGGLISGILLGIPGTPSSVCTVFDGHPMSLNGEPGRALSLGVLSSFFGGLIGALICILIAIPIARFGLKFGPWELFSLMLFALTLIASLGSSSMLKGLMGGMMGLLISTIGIDPIGGRLRFTFGFTELATGISFLPIMIGLFAVPQLLKSVKEIQEGKKKMLSGEAIDDIRINNSIHIPWIKTLKELYKYKLNLLRSGAIGALVGALPAAGGSTAVFIAYDQAQKFSKDPDSFGKGNPNGIIAAEAGNSGVAGGSMIPTIALGIPGSNVAAVMLGALMIHGITPGPMLIKNEPVLTYSIFIALIAAHFIMLALLGVGMKGLIRISNAPKYAVVPVVLSLCVAGSFALNNRLFDVWIFVAFGLIGYYLTSVGMPMAPIVLGLVLGPMVENNLRMAMMTNPDPTLFFTRPISLVFIVLTVVSLAFTMYQNYGKNRKKII